MKIASNDKLRVETRRGQQGNWEHRFAGDLRSCLRYFNGMGLGQDGNQKRLVIVREGRIEELALKERVSAAQQPLRCLFEGYVIAEVLIDGTIHEAKLFDGGDEVLLELDIKARTAEESMTMRKAMGLQPATTEELKAGVVAPDAVRTEKDDVEPGVDGPI